MKKVNKTKYVPIEKKLYFTPILKLSLESINFYLTSIGKLIDPLEKHQNHREKKLHFFVHVDNI